MILRERIDASIADGRVLVVGGWHGYYLGLTAAEVWEPDTPSTAE